MTKKEMLRRLHDGEYKIVFEDNYSGDIDFDFTVTYDYDYEYDYDNDDDLFLVPKLCVGKTVLARFTNGEEPEILHEVMYSLQNSEDSEDYDLYASLISKLDANRGKVSNNYIKNIRNNLTKYLQNLRNRGYTLCLGDSYVEGGGIIYTRTHIMVISPNIDKNKFEKASIRDCVNNYVEGSVTTLQRRWIGGFKVKYPSVKYLDENGISHNIEYFFVN